MKFVRYDKNMFSGKLKTFNICVKAEKKDLKSMI